MALVTDKLVFTHLPKCGGTFIRYVLQQLNIKSYEIGEYHCPYFRIKSKIDNNLVSITSIRHPKSWYQSRWYHRMRLGWVPEAEEDWIAASNDFNKFVENMGAFDKHGRLSTLIRMFDDGPSGRADHVLKQENLNEELLQVLSKYYKIDVQFYNTLKNQNVSGENDKSSSKVAVYDDFVLNDMLTREKHVINSYYDGIRDPKILFESVYL